MKANPILALAALARVLVSAADQTAPASTTTAAAATTAPVAATPSTLEQSIHDIKQPAPWFSWGADIRVRNEYFYDLLTLSPKNPLNEQDYFRFRGRIWSSITPVEDLVLNARLASEPREWMQPAGFTPYKGNSGFDYTEGIIDSLNVQWKNIAKAPLTLSVGRQDLFLGDGWLVGDGTPQDGSATYFLDSARLVYDLKEQHTTIEGIGIVQYARDDQWLPTINNQNRLVTDQNEKGAIFNVVNSSLKAANFNGYFIYKHDTRITDAAAKYGDNADIYTMGGRVSGQLSDHWKYSAEGAYQLGEKQDPSIKNDLLASSARTSGYRDINAFGVNSKAIYQFKDSLNNQLNLSYEFLSGDNANSKDDEMFDVLWGRWPRWSEIGLYSYAPEARIGQQANLHRLGPSWTFTPVKNLDFSLAYYALWSNQEVATRAASSGLFTDQGTFRGHFLQSVLKYKFSAHMSGHLWSEFLFPGDYYVNKNLITFLRAEVMFTL